MRDGAERLLLQHGFDADVEGDVVTEGLGEHGRAGETEFGFLDRAGDFPAGELGAAHAVAEAEELDLEGDGLGGAFEGQVAGDVKGVFACFLPGRALERAGGVFGDVEEVGALDVVVALFVGGVE